MTVAIRKASMAGGATILSSALGACAISMPPAIVSANETGQPIGSIELIASDEVGLRSRFAKDLEAALSGRGVSVESGGAYVGDFSVSSREAAVTVNPISGEETIAGPLPEGIKSRWYHQCKPQRTGATLVVYDRASGAIAGKADGEYISCPGDLSSLDDLAQLLVDRALSK